MGCLCCGAAMEVGALCKSCAQEVSPCEGLIRDHIRATIPTTDAEAWLVDGFGAPHPVAERTVIGRNQENQLVVLAASVSREHAELRKTPDGWHVRDLGSRNGTFVDGTRGQGRIHLAARSVLKVGDVAMWFLAEVVHEPAAGPSLITHTAGGGGLLRYLLGNGDSELCLVGTTDSAAGGALLSRTNGAATWSERGLPPLEFQLLRALCTRATEEANSPATVRGCVATKQLARDLPFQSKYANEENVRQVVRRLRGALAEIGAEGILAVVPGRGYYLACPVTIAGR